MGCLPFRRIRSRPFQLASFPSSSSSSSSLAPSHPSLSSKPANASSETLSTPHPIINPSTSNEWAAFEPISSRLLNSYAAFYNRSHYLQAANQWEQLKAAGYRPVRHSKLDAPWWAEERRRGRVQPDHQLSYPLSHAHRTIRSPLSSALKPPLVPHHRTLHSLARPAASTHQNPHPSPANPAPPPPPRMLHKHSPEIMDLVGDAAAFGLPDVDPTGPDAESDTGSEMARLLGCEPGVRGIKGLGPGSFLELRRTNQSESGILVRSQGNGVLYVSRSGELRLSILDNVMYTMHGLVSPQIASQAIDDDYAIDALNDPIVPMRPSAEAITHEALQEKAATILRARKECCRALRMLEKRVDQCHALLTKAGSYNLYERFKNPDPAKPGQITSSEAVRFLLDQPAAEDERMVFALHQQLMANADMFVANTRDMRDESCFMVQAQNTLTALYTVRDWIALDSAELRAFVTKARTIIQTHRAALASADPDTPLQLANHAFEPWTPTDLMFIQVFRTIATNQRMIQDQPYSTIVAAVLKHIGLYDDDAMAKSWPSLTLDRFGAIALLRDLGILPRWQSVGVWNPELDLETRVGEQARIATRSLGPAAPGKLAAPPPAKHSPRVNTADAGLLASDPADALRYDFGQLPVYIIDDPSAEELDDGISIEPLASSTSATQDGFPEAWIHVHIADPTAALPPSHPLALQASAHLDTLYLPGLTLPMLPTALVREHRMSLGATDKHGRREAQKTLSFSARIDEAGKVVDWKVRPGCIRNTKQLTYDVVSQVLDGTPRPARRQIRLGPQPDAARTQRVGELDAGDVERIRALGVLARVLTRRRVADGALGWHLPLAEAAVAKDPLLWPVLGTPAGPRLATGTAGVCVTLPAAVTDAKSHSWGLSSAQALVMEMMLLAGRLAGRLYGAHARDDSQLLLPFRSQPSPETLVGPQNKRMLDELRKHICPETGMVSPIYFQKSRVVFLPAANGLEPALHFPLGIGADEEEGGYGYCKVTSPLRRYSDLVCHWQIKNTLLRRAGLEAYRDPHGVLTRKGMEGLVMRMDRHGKPMVTVERKASGSWVCFAIREALRGRANASGEEVLEVIRKGLTAVVLQEPVLMRYTNRWSMKTYIPELGIRASLLVDEVQDWFSSWVTSSSGSGQDGIGELVGRRRAARDDPVGKRVAVKIGFVNEEDHVVVRIDDERWFTSSISSGAGGGVVGDLAEEFVWSDE